jgi:hypothetical protein
MYISMSEPCCYFSTYSVRNIINMIPKSDIVYGHYFRYRCATIKRPQTRNLIYWTAIANLLLKMNSPVYCYITPDGFSFLHTFVQIFFVLFDTNSAVLMSALQFWFSVVRGGKRISKGVKWETFSKFSCFEQDILFQIYNIWVNFIRGKRKVGKRSDENVARSRLRRNILICMNIYTWMRLTPERK